jgi:hypothetical protein
MGINSSLIKNGKLSTGLSTHLSTAIDYLSNFIPKNK